VKAAFKRWRLPVYVLLVLISNVVSHRYRIESHPVEGQQVVSVNSAGKNIDIAYRDIPGDDPAQPIPVVLLHGSPMAGQTFDSYPEVLGSGRRVLIPDLPGFGGSTHAIPDYSVSAHADYLAQLLDALHIEQAHVFAYSQSGGVGIHLAERVPDRVASLTLFAAIGVQELELLGDYGLNHAVYSVQLAVLSGLYYLTPHMGLLDRALLNHSYARNFSDTDQRPLRDVLAEYEGPALIIQGRLDTQVPFIAAEEHARIIPQAQTKYFDGGHIAGLVKPEIFSSELQEFWADVDQGTAVTRASADPVRVTAANEPFVRKRFSGHGLVIIFILLVIAVQASEDLALIGAGILVSKGILGLLPALGACYIGLVGGDCVIYLLGRFLGRPALRKRPLRWFISQKKVDKQAHRFKKNMFQLIFTSRFIPGARVAFYFAAGMLRTGFFKFTLYQALAALIWTPLLVGIAALFGQTFLDWFEGHKNLALISIVLLILFLWLLFHKLLPLVTWRGRRMFVSSWRRRVRWEFWPRWAFYPPIALFILWQMVKYRSLRLMLLTNPGMMYGGLMRESKHEIFQGMIGAGDPLLPWVCIPCELSLDGQVTKLKELNQPYPLVLKPDIGYRGQGVGIVGSEEEARAYLDTCPVDVIAQPRIDGVEFGVFYMRDPDEESGRVTSITGKEMPTLTGDGIRTIEELILTDDRAVCMAGFFIDQFGEYVFDVPKEGEVVPLTQLGTHCRGAVFLDRSDLLSDELEAEIDRISKAYEGFYFGRYDIRAPSEKDFRAGRGLKIMELNGLTSESAHIYDPKHSVFYGWKTLIHQWRRAFEIAAANKRNGVRPDNYRHLFKVFRAWMVETTDYEAPLSEATTFQQVHEHEVIADKPV
jgi:membrane protein DedA with SNARE-associated domain/pimeloyl-ACP methyl ester carboxylesterase